MLKKEIIFLLVAIFLSFNLYSYSMAQQNQKTLEEKNKEAMGAIFDIDLDYGKEKELQRMWERMTDEQKASPMGQLTLEELEKIKNQN